MLFACVASLFSQFDHASAISRSLSVIISRMTLMTVTYELQDRLNPQQFRTLGEFSNTYGLHKFHYDEKTNRLMFDYDASRLRETVVEHVLRQSRIPILRRVENS
jgi:hypothetical protein